MRLYFKAVRAYMGAVFYMSKEDREDARRYGDLKYKNNMFKRYKYYTIENFMIVDDSTGRYVEYPMPKPFSIPGKIYHRLLYIWQVKIRKTHI